MNVIKQEGLVIDIYPPEIMALGDPLWPKNRFAAYTRGDCKGEPFIVETVLSRDFIEDDAIDLTAYLIQNYHDVCLHSVPPYAKLYTERNYKDASPGEILALLHYLYNHPSVGSFVCTKFEERLMLTIILITNQPEKGILQITQQYSLADVLDNKNGLEPVIRHLESLIKKAIESINV